MELRTAHSDEILRDLGYALLALVDREIWPINEFLVDLRGGGSPRSAKFSLVPHDKQVHLL
jgi:hypothetical protein